MYNRVSAELREKMANDLVEHFDYRDEAKLSEYAVLDFNDNEMHLHKECIEWREVINTYFLASYQGGALKNFLTYKYIRPEMISRTQVIFSYETNWNPSWKDWFVDKGVDCASILST